MTASTRSIVPGIHVPGAVSCAETSNPFGNPMWRDAFARATSPDYFRWLHHVKAAAGCSRPVRLIGSLHIVRKDPDGGATLLDSTETTQLPDGVIYKACGNRRAAVCPSCSQTYQHDAYQLIRAGLAGGKGVPETIATHPAVFVTFTAPSFGAVHTRVVSKHSCVDRRRCDCRPQPCHMRCDASICQHGNPNTCMARHDPADPRLGQPMCLDCYDHDAQVVWNLFSGELWRRTKQAIERHLAQVAKQRGISPVRIETAGGKSRTVSPVRVAHGKVAEFQNRAAVHFHALLRLDGVNSEHPDQPVPPPDGITVEDLVDAIHAAASIAFDSPPHADRPEGWRIAWGEQLDTRIVTTGASGDISDGKVAGYLAKYATKSTEATGHVATRITFETIDLHTVGDSHASRLIAACWTLGRSLAGQTASYEDDQNPYMRLRRWAHMLGYGGHFLTKGRRYSITFAALRAERTTYRRNQEAEPARDAPFGQVDDADLVVVLLGYSGSGWHTAGDALLANTAAALAREHRRVGREETTLAPAQADLRAGDDHY